MLPWHSERALYVGIIACDVIHTNIMSHLLCGPKTVFMNFCVNPELCLVYHGYVRGLDFFGELLFVSCRLLLPNQIWFNRLLFTVLTTCLITLAIIRLLFCIVGQVNRALCFHNVCCEHAHDAKLWQIKSF